jgi:hypothetical protein
VEYSPVSCLASGVSPIKHGVDLSNELHIDKSFHFRPVKLEGRIDKALLYRHILEPSNHKVPFHLLRTSPGAALTHDAKPDARASQDLFEQSIGGHTVDPHRVEDGPAAPNRTGIAAFGAGEAIIDVCGEPQVIA